MRGHNNASYELLALVLQKIQRHVHNHVFLATHHAAFAQFNQNIHGLQAVFLRRHFRMTQEAGVHTGVAQGQGFSVNPYRTVLQRAHNVVGSVHQGVQVGTMVPAQFVEGSNTHFQRRVAGPGTHAGEAGVDAVTAFFHRHDGVGHTQGQVVVGVDAGLGLRFQHVFEGAEPVPDVVHVHGTAGVDHVQAGGAVVFHQLRLFGETLWGLHVAHHQEADGVHAQLSGVFNVLFGDVRFGAVGGHAHDAGTGLVGVVQVFHGADAGQQQGGDPGVFDHVGHGFDPFQVGVGPEAVVEAGALQAVAVGDFDGIHPGLVQGPGDVLDVPDAVLVANGVADVAQGDVGDVEFFAGVKGHGQAPPLIRDSAMRSAVPRAAEVMMSRLPA